MASERVMGTLVVGPGSSTVASTESVVGGEGGGACRAGVSDGK